MPVKLFFEMWEYRVANVAPQFIRIAVDSVEKAKELLKEFKEEFPSTMGYTAVVHHCNHEPRTSCKQQSLESMPRTSTGSGTKNRDIYELAETIEEDSIFSAQRIQLRTTSSGDLTAKHQKYRDKFSKVKYVARSFSSSMEDDELVEVSENIIENVTSIQSMEL